MFGYRVNSVSAALSVLFNLNANDYGGFFFYEPEISFFITAATAVFLSAANDIRRIIVVCVYTYIYIHTGDTVTGNCADEEETPIVTGLSAITPTS